MNSYSYLVRTIAFWHVMLLLSLLALLPPGQALAAVAYEDPARWESAIQDFEEDDAKAMPPEGAVLFVGSSSIRLWDLEASFPDLVTIKRGFGGCTVADVRHYTERIVLPYRPKTIVFYAGDNDIAGGQDATAVFDVFSDFVKKVRDALPETRILFLSIKPSNARWKLYPEMQKVNQKVQELNKTDKLVELIDVGTPMLGPDGRPRIDLLRKDGLHLNEEGYKLWTGILKPLLKDEKKKGV
ncbi:MAG: hypothetical protein IT364_01675 [Candidatus Hydrogenedentes bacterium]|nr:hypothetical protein [Candidatus Hydrogenedentota bacterium]